MAMTGKGRRDNMAHFLQKVIAHLNPFHCHDYHTCEKYYTVSQCALVFDIVAFQTSVCETCGHIWSGEVASWYGVSEFRARRIMKDLDDHGYQNSLYAG